MVKCSHINRLYSLQEKQMKIRELTKEFKEQLKEGFLSPLITEIRKDNTLDLQIRDNYINIYYRGGNLLRVSEKSTEIYSGFFDVKYLESYELSQKVQNIPDITSEEISKKWVDLFPQLKQQMDYYFTKHPKDEREFQQLVVRENNYNKNISNSTDYFIVDIETAVNEGKQKDSSRFDLMAIKWPADGSSKKRLTGKGDSLRLAFIEMKYGTGSLSGAAGMVKHLQDVNDYIKTPDNLNKMKEMCRTLWNQKFKLLSFGGDNLIHCSQGKEIQKLSDDSPELIFLLSNYNIRSEKLLNEIKEIDKKDFPNIEIKFARSCFMGYALYDDNLLSLKEFKEHLEKVK